MAKFWEVQKIAYEKRKRDEKLAVQPPATTTGIVQKKKRRPLKQEPREHTKVRKEYINDYEDEYDDDECEEQEEEEPPRAPKVSSSSVRRTRKPQQPNFTRGAVTKVKSGETEVDFLRMGHELSEIPKIQNIYPKLRKGYRRSVRNGIKSMVSGNFNTHLTKEEREKLKINRSKVMEVLRDDDLTCNPFDESRKVVGAAYLDFIKDMSMKSPSDTEPKSEEEDGINWDNV